MGSDAPLEVPLTDRIALEHGNSAAALPESVASSAARREALAAFMRSGIPSQRDDVWKYANFRSLARARFAPVPPQTSFQDIAAKLSASADGFARYVFLDGHYAPGLSNPQTTEGFAIHTAAARKPLPARTSPPSADHRFAWLNEAFAVDVASISIPPDIEMPACIELVFVASSDAAQGASYPRIEVHVGADSELCLLERHVSAGAGQSLVDSAARVSLERGAVCQHYRVQQLDCGSTWLDTLDADVGEEAHYQLHQVVLGSESSRSTLEVKLAAERAQLSFDCVALAGGGQMQDVYALVEHAAAHTKTEERFRGIAGVGSRAAFNGKIIVDRNARGADSRQSLRGLISGSRAEVDVRPQLEIYTDDVRCSHGATVGKLDEAMLFYLLSRGIDREAAERLLKRAFIADVMTKIGIKSLRVELEAALASRVE